MQCTLVNVLMLIIYNLFCNYYLLYFITFQLYILQKLTLMIKEKTKSRSFFSISQRPLSQNNGIKLAALYMSSIKLVCNKA